VTPALFLALLFSGILSLLGGLLITRLTWRPDVEPFGRGSPLLQIMMHPERFAAPDRLREIRLLNLLGGILLGGAVAVLVYTGVSETFGHKPSSGPPVRGVCARWWLRSFRRGADAGLGDGPG
jgi:hypothetical protein